MGKPNFYGEEKKLGCITQSLRGLLILINIVFALAAIAAIVVSAMMIEKKDTSYLKFCSVCQRFNYVTIGACALLLVFSLIGLKALWGRGSCALIIYGFYLVIFFIVILAVGIAIVLVHDGKLDSELKTSWEDGVKNDPNAMCQFQTTVGCSGWDLLCNETNSFGNGTETIVPNAECAACLGNDATQIANMTTTCKTKLHTEVNKYYKPLIIVAFSMAGMTALSLVVSCKIKREFEEYQEVNQNFV